jgi:hypothetical protein
MKLCSNLFKTIFFQFSFTNSEWVEATFQKRECARIIPSTRDSNRSYIYLETFYKSFLSLILTRFKSSFMNPQNNGELRSLHWLPSLRKCYLTYSLLLKRLRVIQELKRILKTNLCKSMEFVSRITKTETFNIICIANRDSPVHIQVIYFIYFIITVLSWLFIV